MDPRLKQAVAVGKFRSFSKAADVIGVTQSAVTKSVADLERQIGFPIFQRTSRGAVPTEEGSVFLQRAARLLDDAAELLGSTRPASPYDGILRVGVYPATLEWLLAAPIGLLLKRHPRIKLHITTGHAEQGVEALERGDVDVAIGLSSVFAKRKQFASEHVATVTPILFVRRGHPLLKQKGPGYADIAQFGMVLPSEIWDGSVQHAVAETYGAERNDWMHKIENFPLTCKVVESSDAIGMVDASFMQSEYFQARFATLDGIDFVPPTDVCGAVRAQWEPKPSALALIETLQQAHGNGLPQSDTLNRLFALDPPTLEPAGQ